MSSALTGIENNVELSKDSPKAWMVGGGIAALASAAYLIRDGTVPGGNITIFEESAVIGGSLDAADTAPDHAYSMRGGRMFTEEAYTCLFDLLSFIPSLTSPGKSVKEEIYEFNARIQTNSHARLVCNGQVIDASKLGLTNRDRLDLIEMLDTSEDELGARRIEDVFQASFFKTNFWYMWCTTFAFQTWHSAVELKRYLLRFLQELPRIDTLAGVWRTPYNQYDSIVLPLTDWLVANGVRFLMGASVTALDFKHGPDGQRVETIRYVSTSGLNEIAVGPKDLVFVTNGSMTAASSLGTMTSPPRLATKEESGAWALWESLAKEHTDFGKPSAFDTNIAESKWESFTVTLHDPAFFDLMQSFTGNEAGTGGLVTFTDSNWLMSVVLPHQPHFLGQPEGVTVFWGYGLFPDEEGNFVKKKMSDCSGAEILEELLYHLRFSEHLPRILETSTCIPCMMPFITSEFMPRLRGDRPLVRPVGTTNIAFIGQYCEILDDVVFTVEYSVRSAQTAVYSLLQLDKEVTPIYKAQHDPGALLNSLKAMFH